MEYNTFQHLDQTNFEGLHDQECTHTNDNSANDCNHGSRVQEPVITTKYCVELHWHWSFNMFYTKNLKN